jgi:EPS-associated MarR family transcriptional regulator
MASRRDLQQEEVRFRVLRLLNDNPDLSTRQIADAVGISNGSAYYCLNALMQKGLVKIGNFRASDHKGRYAYVLTPRGLREKTQLTAKFLERKLAEYEALKAEIAALEDEVGEALPARRLGQG